jgi:hypothetical protein
MQQHLMKTTTLLCRPNLFYTKILSNLVAINTYQSQDETELMIDLEFQQDI